MAYNLDSGGLGDQARRDFAPGGNPPQRRHAFGSGQTGPGNDGVHSTARKALTKEGLKKGRAFFSSENLHVRPIFMADSAHP